MTLHLVVVLFALVLGVVAGLRSATAPAAVSWSAAAGWLPLQGSLLGFMGLSWMPWLLTAAALGELVMDKLPMVPSRMALLPFVGRLGSGGLCGAALGLGLVGSPWGGVVAGVLGAGVGTVKGYGARAALAKRLGQDLKAALIEDGVAVVLAVTVALSLR